MQGKILFRWVSGTGGQGTKQRCFRMVRCALVVPHETLKSILNVVTRLCMRLLNLQGVLMKLGYLTQAPAMLRMQQHWRLHQCDTREMNFDNVLITSSFPFLGVDKACI